MLITLTTTERPATDLGHLLHKHPDKAQSFPVAAGTAHVFYPRADADECTAALLLEIDPIELVRGQRDSTFALAQYVNDRPYAAGSMLAVALGSVFSTAMHGRSKSHPDLAARAIPLRVDVPVLPCAGDVELVTRLFAPLGWTVAATPIPLDPGFPEWGDSPYVSLRLTGTVRLAEALRHLYVLLPVLDNGKHYWVSEDEVTKLLRAGEGWLADHPDRELISNRYLAHQHSYVRSALTRLADVDDVPVDGLDNALEPAVVVAEPLAVRRRRAVLDVLRAVGARRVLDLGCGPGALLRELLAGPSFEEIVGVDVSAGALAAAERRLNLDRIPDHQRARITLRQSALTYTDKSLAGYDAAVLMEVIEHVDPDRLPALERAVFGTASPATVVVTTPNAEHNVRFPHLATGRFRHTDHRFEWNRAAFASWADSVAERYGYTVRHVPVGDDDPDVGPPTQLAEFRKAVHQ
ncbi:MAG TPA: 3' terminal RNA ribose 2'-O-methyltransferase Hen1 [Pseudonocardiaceae bacterium]|nr:3' terminal RNA ribose 2'-O-methyltransferase Hen1 [Pseudonocardiaceae bacterium]